MDEKLIETLKKVESIRIQRGKLEAERKELNDYFDSKVNKLNAELKDIYVDLVENENIPLLTLRKLFNPTWVNVGEKILKESTFPFTSKEFINQVHKNGHPHTKESTIRGWLYRAKAKGKVELVSVDGKKKWKMVDEN